MNDLFTPIRISLNDAIGTIAGRIASHTLDKPALFETMRPAMPPMASGPSVTPMTLWKRGWCGT
ncbi:MAG: hypothetical protein AAFQ13_10225 [Pseudomonadota bacterium]